MKRHLQSIPQYVHQETWDGRYKDFDYPCDLSDDGTREVVNMFFNTRLVDAAGYREVEKRQKYLDEYKYKAYKFCLVADSDEYFKGDWQNFIVELDELYDKYYNKELKPVCLGISTKNTNTGEYDCRPRIWLNAHNVLMGPRHNEYRSKVDGTPLYAIEEVKNMRIEHDYKLRYPSYNELRIEYQKKLAAYDAAL